MSRGAKTEGCQTCATDRCLQDVQEFLVDVEYLVLTSGLILCETVQRMAELRGWSREETR